MQKASNESEELFRTKTDESEAAFRTKADSLLAANEFLKIQTIRNLEVPLPA